MVGRFATIYLIRNEVSGQAYVGHTVYSVERRFNGHCWLLNRGKHHSRILQKSWEEHGRDAFCLYAIETCAVDDRMLREQYWIDRLAPEYNTAPVAGSVLGMRWTNSPETIKKRLEAKLITMDQTIVKLSYARRNTSEESENRRRDAIVAFNQRPDIRAKRSDYAKRSRCHTALMAPDTIENRIAAMRITRQDPVVRARISEGMKAYWQKRRSAELKA